MYIGLSDRHFHYHLLYMIVHPVRWYYSACVQDVTLKQIGGYLMIIKD